MFQELAERVAQINTNTLVSVGTLVTVVGIAIKLTKLLSSIEFSIKDLRSEVNHLKSMPVRLGAVEDNLMLMENDINNLWALQRGGQPEQTRRERFRPVREV